MVDYSEKCGTCIYFERNGETRRGWCHMRKYGAEVFFDRKHPYPLYSMSRAKCAKYIKRGAVMDEEDKN